MTTTSTAAHDLTDRTSRVASLRTRRSELQQLRRAGSSIRDIAQEAGVSYEWAWRVVKNVAYDYVADDAIAG
jgi:molybdenum-dependent DNA-binding transcriptional regulator ModE